jgi:hypothetical protein
MIFLNFRETKPIKQTELNLVNLFAKIALLCEA